MGVANPGSDGPCREWRNLEVADPNPILVYGTSSICLSAPNRRRSYVGALRSALFCRCSFVVRSFDGSPGRGVKGMRRHTFVNFLYHTSHMKPKIESDV